MYRTPAALILYVVVGVVLAFLLLRLLSVA